MKREFWLPNLEPLSINSTYIRGHNGVVKSSAARQWTQTLFHMLNQPQHIGAFAWLRDIDLKTQGYKFTITTVYEESVFFTKKKELSSRTQDLSNTEKSLIDCFCLPKFAVEEPPYGIQNLQCDDKHVVELVSRKAYGTKGTHVIVEIVPLPARITIDS
jgi:hypothetical protein